jgi:hypothetical protein
MVTLRVVAEHATECRRLRDEMAAGANPAYTRFRQAIRAARRSKERTARVVRYHNSSSFIELKEH